MVLMHSSTCIIVFQEDGLSPFLLLDHFVNILPKNICINYLLLLNTWLLLGTPGSPSCLKPWSLCCCPFALLAKGHRGPFSATAQSSFLIRLVGVVLLLTVFLVLRALFLCSCSSALCFTSCDSYSAVVYWSCSVCLDQLSSVSVYFLWIILRHGTLILQCMLWNSYLLLFRHLNILLLLSFFLLGCLAYYCLNSFCRFWGSFCYCTNSSSTYGTSRKFSFHQRVFGLVNSGIYT